MVKFRKGMETKCFEIRDRNTLIPAIAIAVEGDRFLTKKAGYGERRILLGSLMGGMFHCDPFQWGDRTWTVVHKWLEERWDSVPDSEVIDVEYLLGETPRAKLSERFL